MATLDNGHASDGIVKAVGNNEVPLKHRRTNLFRWTLGLVVRLCIWYVLLTPFFRCPSRLSDLNESSPRVCKPYIIARSYVEPHVLPYYNTYGAPYVEKAHPYVVMINEKVYTPAANVAKLGYDKYGAPAVDQAHAYGSQQWERQVLPRLQSAKDSASEMYNSDVAPHVQRATEVVSPYYQKANTAFNSACVDYIQPFLARTSPLIGKTYTSGQDILTTTVIPYAQSSWSTVIYVANGWLWPKITGLYSENVEPQLVKIGQRLASYREGKQLRKVVDEVDSFSDEQVRVASASSEASRTESYAMPSTTVASLVSHTMSPTERVAQSREKIESDLRTWQEKFAAAVDKGFVDLEGRLYELVEGYINDRVKSYGESLVPALETIVEHELSSVKLRIGELTESLPNEDSPAEKAAQAELSKDIRQAAIAIRDRAHAIREWHKSFDQELVRRVSIAVNSTLDVLDSVRDLGLQEIGMRWAWMDGVTYKDWARYHTLKAQFEDWKGKFRDVGMHHSKLEDARALSDDILSRGMDAAEAAAKELARLKNVGKWKIAAREVSDNFDTRSCSPPPRPKPSDQPVTRPQEQYLDATSTNLNTSIHHEVASTGSPVQGITEFEEQTLGLDDAPLAHDWPISQDEVSPSEESGSSEFSAEFTSYGERDLPPALQTDGEEDDSTGSSWGVAAAEILLEQDVSDQGEAAEGLYSILEKASDKYTEATASAGTDSFHFNGAQDPNLRQASASSGPHYEAVENLISELLAGKDPSFAQNVMDKLQAIYGSPERGPELYTETVAGQNFAFTRSSSRSTPVSEDAVKDTPEQFQFEGCASYEGVTSSECAPSSAFHTSSATSEPAIAFESTREQDTSFAANANGFASEATKNTASHMQNSNNYFEHTPASDDL